MNYSKKTIELYQKELRKISKKINAYYNKLNYNQDDINVQRAELIRRKNRTRSNNVVKECEQKLWELDQYEHQFNKKSQNSNMNTEE